MASAQIINCIACKEPVRPHQQGLQCWLFGTIDSATLGYPLRRTMQQLTKGLRSSGDASSANIPMLTAPWRTSPFLTHLQRKHPCKDSALEPDLLSKQPPDITCDTFSSRGYHFLLLGLRVRTGASLPHRQPHIQIHPKADGPTLSTRSWYPTHVQASQRQRHNHDSSGTC